jgi:hypothetical protein
MLLCVWRLHTHKHDTIQTEHVISELLYTYRTGGSDGDASDLYVEDAHFESRI